MRTILGVGQKLTGHAIALIIAASEADAEYYALHELGFISLSAISLVGEFTTVLNLGIKNLADYLASCNESSGSVIPRLRVTLRGKRDDR